ncbi:hypothetical protein D3C72_2447060 [compost metagenome]
MRKVWGPSGIVTVSSKVMALPVEMMAPSLARVIRAASGPSTSASVRPSIASGLSPTPAAVAALAIKKRPSRSFR